MKNEISILQDNLRDTLRFISRNFAPFFTGATMMPPFCKHSNGWKLLSAKRAAMLMQITELT